MHTICHESYVIYRRFAGPSQMETFQAPQVRVACFDKTGTLTTSGLLAAGHRRLCLETKDGTGSTYWTTRRWWTIHVTSCYTIHHSVIHEMLHQILRYPVFNPTHLGEITWDEWIWCVCFHCKIAFFLVLRGWKLMTRQFRHQMLGCTMVE